MICNLRRYFGLFCLLSATIADSNAQFAPAAGMSGTTAVHKDSSIIAEWATGCVVVRGYIDISNPAKTYTQADQTSNYAFYGQPAHALGPADGIINTVSLGDGGTATLTFAHAIRNGAGPDFVVFENGFRESIPPQLYFLELAFVEVSSDGSRFVRFPATSLTPADAQVGTYDQLNPEHLHNLAGKYVANYGTPFDLEDLSDSTGIDFQRITHIRIVDVVGNINEPYATRDAQGNRVNDPWPTPFWSAGFDLDAVGVIHSGGNPLHLPEKVRLASVECHQNQLFVHLPSGYSACAQVVNLQGGVVFIGQIEESALIELPGSGLYLLRIRGSNIDESHKLIIGQ